MLVIVVVVLAVVVVVIAVDRLVAPFREEPDSAARCALTRYVNNDVHAWNSIDCERSATEIRRTIGGSRVD